MENDQNLELENNEQETTEGNEAEQQEKPAEKPKLTPEQIKGIKQRQFTKLAKELGIEVAKPESGKKSQLEKKEFDYGELAYLAAKGVPDEDLDFLFEEAQTTGKPLKALLGFNYVKEELKNRKEARETKEALPKGSKRSGASPKNDVDYWINKGELPPPDQVELRRKVVNERIKREKEGSKFAR